MKDSVSLFGKPDLRRYDGLRRFQLTDSNKMLTYVGMQEGTIMRKFYAVFSLVMILCAFQARADVVVIDDGIQFSPDPVHIVTGEVVEWDDDGSGPYSVGVYNSSGSASGLTPFGVRFTRAGTYYVMDEYGVQGTIYVSPNVPPTVAITAPADGAVFAAPATFDFTAVASDTDSDGLSDVEFHVGTNFVDDIFSPFGTSTATNTTSVTNLAAGTYTLAAIAFDNSGATATSSITITVQAGSAIKLAPPVITAGKFVFGVTGLTAGKTNVLQTTANLDASNGWTSLSTNVATSSSATFTNTVSPGRHFFRVMQLP
jgi:plastocyanin